MVGSMVCMAGATPPAAPDAVELSWKQTLEPPAGRATTLSIGSNGEVCAAGTIGPEPPTQPTRKLLAARFAADGTLKWSRVFGTDDHHYQASAIMTDPGGKVWLAALEEPGAVPAGLSGSQGLLLHYDANGELLWARRFGADTRRPPLLALDRNGNAFAAADTRDPRSTDLLSPHRLLVSKISPTGSLLWSHIASHVYDLHAIHDVVVQGDDRVRILAQPTSEDGSVAPFVATYLTDGTVAEPGAWTVWEYAGANSVAGRWTPEGNLVLLAPSSSRAGGRYQGGALVSAFSATGARRFHTTSFLTPTWDLLPSMLQPDSRGGTLILATARTREGTLPPNDDFLVQHVDANGRWDWSARYNGADSAHDRATGVALDSNGAVYVSAVVGRVDPPGEAFAVLKLSTNGTQLWETPAEWGGAFAVAVSSDGEVFASGYMSDTASSAPRFALAKFVQRTAPQPPTIAVIPSEQQVNQGEPVTWRTEVTGLQPLAYQWRRNGQILPQKTNATLTLPTTALHDRGDYSVVVTHASGKAVSPEARLVLRLPPSLQGTTANVRVTAGRSTLLEVAAIGDEPLRYQWFRDSNPLPSATNRFLSLENLHPDLAGAYHVVVTNAIGAADATIQVEVTPGGPLDAWTWRHPLPQGNDLHGAAHGLNRYIVVGDAGTLLSSADLQQWTSHGREEFGDLLDVIFARNRFLALGDAGQIVTSTNGVQWSVTRLAPGTTLAAIAHGNDTTVIVGSSNALPIILASTDGETWKHASLPGGFGVTLSDITFGHGRFFASVRSGPPLLLISTNGLDWTAQTTDPLGVPSGALVTLHHAGEFLIGLTSQGNAYLSADGARWSETSLPTPWDLRSVTGPDHHLVAVGRVRPATSDADAARVFHSTNGVDWTTNQLSLGNNLHHIAHAQDRLIALGDDGHLLHSTNGTDWTQVTASTDRNLNDIAFGAGHWVAVGQNGLVLKSADGRQWTPLPTPGLDPRLDMASVAYGAGRFVAATDDHGLWSSVTGDRWEVVLDIDGPQLHEVEHLRNLFIAVGASGTILTSPDGLQWTSRPLGISEPLHCLAENSERLVAAGWMVVATSVDGLSWTRTTVDPAFETSSLAFGNGRFVATSVSGRHWISTNGLDWRSQNSLPGPGIGSVHFLAGRFIASGVNGLTYSSMDGEVWQEHFAGSENRLRSLALSARGTLVGVGSNGLIMESAPLLPSLALRLSSNQEGQLEIRGWPGPYHLQAADDLPPASWRNLISITISNASTPVNYTDPEPRPQRFYRIAE